jgi:hypothetical protein
MKFPFLRIATVAAAVAFVMTAPFSSRSALAQEQPAADEARGEASATQPLTADQLDVLVANRAIPR